MFPWITGRVWTCRSCWWDQGGEKPG